MLGLGFSEDINPAQRWRQTRVRRARRFKPGSELGYAAGGSGTLVKTDDGGRSWKRDRSTDEVAGNLYAIKWTKAGPTVGLVMPLGVIILVIHISAAYSMHGSCFLMHAKCSFQD